MERRLKRIALFLFCFYIVAVILMCVIKTESLPELPKVFLGIPFDKIAHFIMFLPFPILGYSAFYPSECSIAREIAVVMVISVIGFVFAAATEGLQSMTEYRTADSMDMMSNAIGLMTGAAASIIYIIFKRK